MNPPFIVLVNPDYTECMLATHPYLKQDTAGRPMHVIAVLEHMSWDEACAIKLAIFLKLTEIREHNQCGNTPD